MIRVLLISMPFASTRYPSPALSLLKALLQEQNISCDIAYLNILFQAVCGRPDVYEGIADFLVAGEWVFGEELFGREWAESRRSDVTALAAPLFPTGPIRSRIQSTLVDLRRLAGPFLANCLRNIPWERYSVVGFTSVFSQQVASLALARRIKAHWPDKTIAFGGANCQDEMGAALLRLFPFVDWVFNGEADLALPQAVRCLADGKSLPDVAGLMLRRDGAAAVNGMGEAPDLNGLPYPDFSDYFGALRRWAPSQCGEAPLTLELSRGCWWGQRTQCVFCGLNCKSLSYRHKRADRAEAEIRCLTEAYGVDKIMLADAILHRGYFKTLLPALAEWGGLSELFVETRSNLNCEQVRLLKAAGVRALQPGIESLDSELLRYMHKGTHLLETIRFLKCARESDLFPAWNLLYGFPGENPAAYRRMYTLIPSICHLHPPMDLSPVVLVRFSPMFVESAQWDLENVRAHHGYRAVYPFGPDDLNSLAYFFEADDPGVDVRSSYIDPLRRQVDAWKSAWKQAHPPGLTYETDAAGRVIIRDDRPGRAVERIVLDGPAAAAYVLCDTAQPFDRLAARTAAQCSSEILRTALNDLVDDRLMLEENDRYLNLAVKPNHSLDVSEDW